MSVEEEQEAAAPPYPPKQDPETLVLRGRPRPVVRFKRGLIVGVAAFASASLVAIAWFALAPPSFRLATHADETSETRQKATPDALANAPTSYGDVPRLGPPLPGDLGRPILDHERLAQDSADPRQMHPADSQAGLQRQQSATERKAARESGLMVQVATRPARNEAGTAPGTEGAPVQPVPPVASSAAALADPNHQQHKLEFARSEPGETNPHSILPPSSPWMLTAGSIIPASLVTGLDSDLPGLVVAQVTDNVFDSASGRKILIPQGARLIGKYDSVIAFGQRRALVVWQRIVFPDASSMLLDNVPATDLSGYSGLQDKVDSHTWRLLKGVAISTLLGVGSQVGFGNSGSDLVRALREATQQNAAHAGDQITARNLDVQPTIKVRPGWPVAAVIHKDLVLPPWKG